MRLIERPPATPRRPGTHPWLWPARRHPAARLAGFLIGLGWRWRIELGTIAVDLGWQDGKRRRPYVYGKTEAEVVAKLQQLQRQVWSGEPVLTGRETLGEYLESWLADTLPGTVKASTQRSYTDIARRHIIPELGRIPLRKLTPAHVRRLLRTKSAEHSSRGRALSPRTVQYIHSVLRRALEQARRDELVPRNVAKLVQPPRVPRPQRRWLTDEQARRLLDELGGTGCTPSTPWRSRPGCAAARCSGCAGPTRTWTPARCTCARHCSASTGNWGWSSPRPSCPSGRSPSQRSASPHYTSTTPVRPRTESRPSYG